MVNWTAENDSKLLAGILAVHDVKIQWGPLADYMKQAIGEDVTAKALTHRVANLKKKARDDVPGFEPPTVDAEGNPLTPKKPRATKPKTPKQGLIASEIAAAEADATENGAGGGDNIPASPETPKKKGRGRPKKEDGSSSPTTPKKRATPKKSANSTADVKDEVDGGSPPKKLKTEVSSDVDADGEETA